MPRTYHPDAFPCIDCPAHFSTREEQVSHLQKEHASEQPWLCFRCPSSFSTRDECAQHIANGHRNPAYYSLCFCGNSFRNEESKSRHLLHDHKEQEGRDKRSCLTCGFENESFVGISLHMLHVHAHRCAWCSKGFVKERDLDLHLNGKDADGECPELAELLLPNTITPSPTPAPAPAPMPGLALPPRSAAMPASTTSYPLSPASYGTPVPLTLEEIGPAKWQKVAASTQPDEPQHARAKSLDQTQKSPHLPHNLPHNLPTPPPSQQTLPPGRPLVFPPHPQSTPETAALLAGVTEWTPTRITYLNNTFSPSDFDPATVYETTHPSRSSYRERPPLLPDAWLFGADPRMLAYGNLLSLAQRYRNVDIFERVNAGRAERVFNSVQALESRMRSACVWSAEMRTERGVPTTAEEVREWVRGERAKVGIFPRVVGQRVAKRKRPAADELLEGGRLGMGEAVAGGGQRKIVVPKGAKRVKTQQQGVEGSELRQQTPLPSDFDVPHERSSAARNKKRKGTQAKLQPEPEVPYGYEPVEPYQPYPSPQSPP